MKKRIFKVEGIDCANCAGKIERDLQKVYGEESVSLSFMTGRLTMQVPDEAENVDETVRKIVHKTEPDAAVTSVR
jgi:copper chaperone CopZ